MREDDFRILTADALRGALETYSCQRMRRA